jgi:hypothetical protein
MNMHTSTTTTTNTNNNFIRCNMCRVMIKLGDNIEQHIRSKDHHANKKELESKLNLELVKKSYGNDVFSVASRWKQEQLRQEEEGYKNL